MASTKAYQARKHEIEQLNADLYKAQSDLHAAQAYIATLRVRYGIFADYIRHAYWQDLDNPVGVLEDWDALTGPVEIPKCMKPYDAIKYAGGPEPMAFPPADPEYTEVIL